ncbi:hypothetical protein Q9R30_13985 [Arthrobacter sp. AB6]|uniref:hypothetical protein n=1 Tax=Arthrobacter sp. AB6 TaxID=2962570 RepID=UPI00288198AA|nr:hypothetical protein [Arthrobacter sp. AB6]MDT0196469.1 hypothetical protein [Arthrobacter sp. AB6]
MCINATYILLTQSSADRFPGIGVLSLTVPITATTAAVIGVPQAAGQLTPRDSSRCGRLATLVPVLPIALEPVLAIVHGRLILYQLPFRQPASAVRSRAC